MATPAFTTGHTKSLNLITSLIAIGSFIATCVGIFSAGGPGKYEITSIRHETVEIYGRGAYRDMSAEVAPQGIAQDVVTLCIGIPLLLLSLVLSNRNSLRGRLLLTGTLGYFFITYLFFTLMAMYNQLFLLWVALLSLSFFGFILSFTSFNAEALKSSFHTKLPVKFLGRFLMCTAVAIALLWLSIVVPPLATAGIPKEVEHYTTLVVQALDLGILLPACFISGLLLSRRNSLGYLIAPVYTIFLALLMTALTAKVLAMSMLGYNAFPAIVIIPLFMLMAVASLFLFLKNVNTGLASDH